MLAGTKAGETKFACAVFVVVETKSLTPGAHGQSLNEGERTLPTDRVQSNPHAHRELVLWP